MTRPSLRELALTLGLVLLLGGFLVRDTRPSWICTDYDADAFFCRAGELR